MKKIFFISCVFIIMISIGLYFYMYQDHRDIGAEKANYVTTLNTLDKEFLSNSTASNTKYLDKTIEVYGKITNVDDMKHAIVIDKKLYATFKSLNLKVLKLNNNIKIKGRFIGYDDLLEEFRIDQAIIIE